VTPKSISKAFLEPLFLASTSPRRAEILRAVGWPFELVSGGIDETRYPDEEAHAYVKRLAGAKAMTAAARLDSGLVLGADTIVFVEGEVLGQPRDEDDARRMLRLLRGKWHEVFTGIALVRADQQDRCLVEHETTRVRFSSMSDREIDWYVATGEPLGKAGAYGIQGPAALFIREIAGDYLNIVGLPIKHVYELWQKLKSP
jgi:septum formation protein